MMVAITQGSCCQWKFEALSLTCLFWKVTTTELAEQSSGKWLWICILNAGHEGLMSWWGAAASTWATREPHLPCTTTQTKTRKIGVGTDNSGNDTEAQGKQGLEWPHSWSCSQWLKANLKFAVSFYCKRIVKDNRRADLELYGQLSAGTCVTLSYDMPIISLQCNFPL